MVAKKLVKQALAHTTQVLQAVQPKKTRGTIQHILIMHLKPLGFGDLIMQSPGFVQLKKQLAPKTFDILTSYPDVIAPGVFDTVHTWNKKKTVQQLKRKYDLIVMPAKMLTQAYVMRALQPKHHIGFTNSWKLYADFHHKKYTYTVDDHYLQPLEHIIDSLGGNGKKVYTTTIPRLSSKEHNLDIPKNYIVVTPNVAWKSRTYPLPLIVEVLQELRKILPIALIGYGKKDEAVALAIQEEVDCIDVVGKTTIPQTIKLLENASLHLCADSGPMHLGLAQQTPTVALFGPINPYVRMPYFAKNSIGMWRGDKIGYRCKYDLENETTWEECNIIKDINPKLVIEACRSLLP